MYMISGKVIKFIKHTTESWWAELKSGGKSLTEEKIQRGIFQADALSPLLFIIAMMPHNYRLKKYTSWYKLHKSQEKNNQMYMDDIKLFAKNEKELKILIQAVRIYSHNIGMEFGIEKCATLIMKSGKRHMTERIELPNQEKIRTLGEKGNRQILGNIGSRHH